MTRHDMQLWAYANKELELGEHRFVEAHLEVCPECSDELASITLAREALSLAREAGPAVTWGRVDERVGALVEKRLARQARGPWLRRLAFGGGGLLAVAALAALIAWWPRPEPLPMPLTEPSVPVSSWARVDRAEGLSRVGGDKGAVVDGTELHGGDVIRTSMVGKAFVHLPDLSHLRVGAGSQLALTRSEADDVALTLERGTLAVRASHRPRKGFVVHTGGVLVTVIGTVFGVTNDADVVEVSVSEGRVKIELPNGETSFVEPGQRLRFDTRTEKVKQLKVAPAMEKQLAEVVAADDAVTAVEGKAIGPAVGGSPSAPPMLTAQGTPRSLPRLSADEARARQVQAPAPLQPDELTPLPAMNKEPAAPAAGQTTVVIEAPPDVWPSIGGGEVIRGVPARRESAPAPAPVAAPVVAAPPIASQPSEWAEAPKPDESEWSALPAKAPAQTAARLSEDDAAAVAPAPAPAPAAAPPVVAVVVANKRLGDRDLEAQFLAKADESVAKGGACERFLLGLEEIAQDAQRSSRSEVARVLRARCFDVQMRPRQAMGEYRKYLEEYPRGKFAAEAHEALGD